MNGHWIRSQVPALRKASDERILEVLKIIEKEKGVYVIANVVVIWLLVFWAIERLAVRFEFDVFFSVPGMSLLIAGILLASVGSKLNHRRYMKKLLIRKCSELESGSA